MLVSVMDVSDQSKFHFITAAIKALSLLQGSDGKLFSQTTSCHLQLSSLSEMQTGTENGAQLSCFYVSAVGAQTRSTSMLSPIRTSGQPGICPGIRPSGFLSYGVKREKRVISLNLFELCQFIKVLGQP